MSRGKYIIGPGAKLFPEYADQELNYANKGFVLEFFHVPSGKFVQFKAMLTDFKDRYESSWKQEQVYGRNDPIQNFQGTKRIISIAWDLVAASWGEAKDNLQKATLLNSMLYPSYADASGDTSTIVAAPIFKLSFANLIRSYGNDNSRGDNVDTGFKKQQYSVQKSFNDVRQEFGSRKSFASPQDAIKPIPIRQKIGKGAGSGIASISGLVGTVSGFTYSPVIDNGFFDPREEQGKLYPQTIALSCEYTVMHTHRLGWKGKEFRNSHFPYGSPVENINGSQETNKSVMRSNINDSGTRGHKKAKENIILKGIK